MILIGLPLLALTTWQMGALDLTTSDTTIKLWLAGARRVDGPGDDAVDDRRPERGAAAPDEPRLGDDQRHAPGLRLVRHGHRRDDPAARARRSTPPSCRRRSRPKTSRCSS